MPCTFDFEAPPPPLVEVKNLSLEYRTAFYHTRTWRDLFVGSLKLNKPRNVKRLRVLDNISFSIQAGERVGLLGVNGAGKTTLCRCVAGIFRPTSGEVTVRGKLRAVFDTSIGIFPELTGRENARILAQFLYPHDVQDHPDIVDDALVFSELGKALDMPFKTYSNGMQARLCLSMISAVAPDVLILDEVFDGADKFFREKISARVVDLIEKSGAVIFVSHSMDQLLKVCTRVIFVNEQRILFDGSPQEAIDLYHATHGTKKRPTDRKRNGGKDGNKRGLLLTPPYTEFYP